MSSESPIKEAVEIAGELENKLVIVDDERDAIKEDGPPAVSDGSALKEGEGPESRHSNRRHSKEKTVLFQGVKGTVKWYNVRYHYGFIARDDDRKNDVFVHQTAIVKSHTKKFYLRTLDDDEEVLFDVVEGKKGLEAANVTGPNGTEVRGSRYHQFQFYSFRQRFARMREDHMNNRENAHTRTSEGSEEGERRRVRTVRRQPKKISENAGGKGEENERESPRDTKGKERRRKLRKDRRHRPGMKKNVEEAGDANKDSNKEDESVNGEDGEKRSDRSAIRSNKPGERRRGPSPVNGEEESVGEGEPEEEEETKVEV